MARTKLTAQERRTYRQQLQALTARIAGELEQLDAEVLHPLEGEDCEVLSQSGDRPARAAEEDRARVLIASEAHIRDEATAALGRLMDGSFGMCEQCGHPIARARLETVPYARTCTHCARTVAPAAAT